MLPPISALDPAACVTASPRRRLRAVEETSRNAAGGRESQSLSDTAALVEQAKTGDREAFDRLVRITYADAYALALRLTANTEDARDVVQETYLRAYRSIGRFRGDAQFSTWIYRIVANCSSTLLSRRQRYRYDELTFDQDIVDTRPEHDPALQGDLAELEGQPKCGPYGTCLPGCARWWCSETCTTCPTRPSPRSWASP